MWDHIYRLADMLASTKECVEDTFGAGVDMGRGNKNPFSAGTIDRLHHLQSFWVRLDSSEWPKVRPVANDFAETAGRQIGRRCNVGSYAPESKMVSTFRLATMKKHRGLNFESSAACILILNTIVAHCWGKQ